MTVAALGVVFGDIGTSPLYVFQAVFDPSATRVVPFDPVAVYGVVSLIVWAVVLVVFVKYVALIMQADNDGEGGIMALVSLLSRERVPFRSPRRLVLLGIVGAALFFGDSLITPAISVLSAVEGLDLVDPALHTYVLPVATVVIVTLFAIQRAGTGLVGGLFGPVMLVWFLVIGGCGLRAVAADPAVLRALSPSYAVAFFELEPVTAFLALGGVVLAVTGAEALYADLGHFGASPIRRAWMFVVFPALVLNYLGQGSLILRDPPAAGNPFFLLVPSSLLLPLVLLATAATVIASQAVISGAFSLARQATRLGYVPRLEIRHTSARDPGQVYVPVVNAALMLGVLTLVVSFRSSARLAAAYGIAVTGTMLITSVLFLSLVRHRPSRRRRAVLALLCLLIMVDLAFLAANAMKIPHGGWLPLLVAAVVFTVMANWHASNQRFERRRAAKEGPIADYISHLDARRPRLNRIQGLAVFLTRPGDTTAPALQMVVDRLGTLHEHVVIVTVSVDDVPRVPPQEQATIEVLDGSGTGILRVRLRYGFDDRQSVPEGLHHALRLQPHIRPALLGDATYFVSTTTPTLGGSGGITRLRQHLYVWTARWATDPIRYYDLPPVRTLMVGRLLMLS